jgi:hypothetical protein
VSGAMEAMRRFKLVDQVIEESAPALKMCWQMLIGDEFGLFACARSQACPAMYIAKVRRSIHRQVHADV